MRVIKVAVYLKQLLRHIFSPISSRVLAAIIGAYVLANCLSILLAYLLPMPKADGVLVGIQFSFVIYACAVMWVFAAKSAWRAWLGLLVPGFVSAALLYFLIPQGLL